MKRNLFENMNITDNSYLLDDELLKSEIREGRSREEEVPLDDLEAFPGHPFMVSTETEDFAELVGSIRDNGVIYPILVRPLSSDGRGEKYQIISGHRRAAAGRAAGLDKIPAVIRPMDDYESTVLMVHSNLYRPEISIKEKARAYRMCHDAEKHQGRHIGGDTAASIGASASDSRRKVYRYIRLSYLTDRLLGMVDGKKLAINIGVELSYLLEEEQEILFSVMKVYGILPSAEQAAALRKMSAGGNISQKEIIALLAGDAGKKAAKGNITFKKKDLQDFFEPDTDIGRMSEIIMRLLAKYKEGLLDGFID